MRIMWHDHLIMDPEAGGYRGAAIYHNKAVLNVFSYVYDVVHIFSSRKVGI